MKIMPGSRWKSAVCTAEVVVVKPPTTEGELYCGGAAMLAMNAERPEGGTPASGHDSGTLLGKRYHDADSGLEALCTKAGAGSLDFAGRALGIMETKRLPSSD